MAEIACMGCRYDRQSSSCPTLIACIACMTFLVPRYDPRLVLVSVLAAGLASCFALGLARRLRTADRRTAVACWVAGSIVMGFGIWALHGIGLAALDMAPVPTWGGTLVAAFTAIGFAAAAVALGIFVRQRLQRAGTDVMTGLPTRAVFEDRLAHAVARAERAAAGPRARDGSVLAVLMVDVDRLGTVNASFGRAAGDLAVRAAAARLRDTVRHSDTVARIGGDEFLVLLEDADGVEGCVALAQRLIEAIEHPLDVQARQIELSASVGIALYPDHGGRDDLAPHADAAMHEAKRRGGGACAVYEPGMDDHALEQFDLMQDLRHAAERGELRLHYQPKLGSRNGELRGVEALLRWQHPVRGPISPDIFIPLAERHGLIHGLGSWVIDEACRQLREWADAGFDWRLAVNISVQQLRRGDLALQVAQALERHRIQPAQLLCEITESVMMQDVQGTQQTFERLQRLGVYLSIDDFGTGYSSLSYLRQLPARQLKIDRSFVRDLESSADARAIVDAVIRLAHALGLAVVAEGVETAGQREVLLQLGCDELQGYLLARPMTAQALFDWAQRDAVAGRPDLQRGNARGELVDEAATSPSSQR